MSDVEPLNILDVLAHYGANTSRISMVGWKSIKCPFHGDSTASASVNVDLGAFKCHTCGMTGDAIKLIREQEKIGYDEAVEFSRQVLGKSHESIPRTTTRGSKGKQRKPRRFISI